MDDVTPDLITYMVEHASDVISLHDSNGKCFCVSPSVADILGYQPTVFQQLPTSALIHPDDLDMVQTLTERVVHDVPSENVELRVKHSMGHYVWIETTVKRSPHPIRSNEVAIVATSRNVTDRKMEKDQLIATQVSNQRLIDLLPDMVVIFRRNHLVYMNPTGLQMMGVSSLEELKEIDLIQSAITIPEKTIRACLRTFLVAGTVGPIEQRLQTMLGQEIDVEASATQIEFNGEPATLWLVRDITSRKEVERTLEGMNRQLHTLSTRDPLTNVGNRRVFDELIQQSMALHQTRNTTVALMILDIDCFKLYNDTYGHQQGDACLKAVANAIVSASQTKAVVTRYGGEEFAIVLPKLSVSDAVDVAEEIHVQIKNLNVQHEVSIVTNRITVSIGIGFLSGGENGSIDTLIRRADAALYYAKQTGRNQSILWDPSLEQANIIVTQQKWSTV